MRYRYKHRLYDANGNLQGTYTFKEPDRVACHTSAVLLIIIKANIFYPQAIVLMVVKVCSRAKMGFVPICFSGLGSYAGKIHGQCKLAE